MERRSLCGFTLIELMIAVVIIGILAAIAYPSYQEQVRRTNRAEAQRTLMDTAQRLERCYTEYNVYNSVNCSIVFPVISERGYYSIAKTVDTATTYTLTATRAGTQATDRCGDFTLTHTGAKNIVNANDGLTLDDCWK